MCNKEHLQSPLLRAIPSGLSQPLCLLGELFGSSSAYCFALALMVLSDVLSRLLFVKSNSFLLRTNDLVGDVGFLLMVLRIIAVVRFERRRCLLFGSLLVTFGVGYVSTGNSALVKALVLLIASNDIELWKVTRICCVTYCLGVAIGLASWVASAFLGQQLVGFGGFDHKNQFALALFLIIALWLVERATYRKAFRIGEWSVVAAIILVTALIVQSKTATVCMIVFVAMCLALRRGAFTAILDSTAGRIFVKAFQGLCLLFSVGSALLLPLQPVVQVLDRIMTNRIWLNWYALQNHALALFGSNVNLNEGTGKAFNFVLQTGNNAITVDNTYILSLYILGVLPTIALTVLFAWVMNQFYKNGRYIVICAALVLCLYGLMEAQMIDVFNNYIFILPLTTVHTPAHFKGWSMRPAEGDCTRE